MRLLRLTLVLLLVFLFAISVQAGTWKDDFEDGEIGESWTPKVRGGGPTDWRIDDGILKGHWPDWSGQMIFLEEYPSLDYTIEVKCRIDRVWQAPRFAGTGIIFRSSGPEDDYPSYYAFGITTPFANFFIDRGGAAGNWNFAITTVKNHNIFQWYKLKLVISGDRFIGYVDDKLVCKLHDDNFKGRFVGLLTASNTDGSFDDFMISDRVDETAFTEFAVSPEDIVLTTKWASLKVK